MNEDRAAIFAANLRALITSTGLTKREVAESARVDYKWLRRLSTQGLKRRNSRSVADLEKLAAWFGVTEFALWNREPEQIVVDSCFAKEWPSAPAEFCERFKALCPMQYWLLVGAARTEEKMLERVESALSLSEPKSVARAWRHYVLHRVSVVLETPKPYSSGTDEEAYRQLVGRE